MFGVLWRQGTHYCLHLVQLYFIDVFELCAMFAFMFHSILLMLTYHFLPFFETLNAMNIIQYKCWLFECLYVNCVYQSWTQWYGQFKMILFIVDGSNWYDIWRFLHLQELKIFLFVSPCCFLLLSAFVKEKKHCRMLSSCCTSLMMVHLSLPPVAQCFSCFSRCMLWNV